MEEYKPITHHCDCCGGEVEDEEVLFEADNGKLYCEECFRDFIIDNLDIYEIAELWSIPARRACEYE